MARASLQSLLTTFLWPTGVAAATGLVLLALGAGSSIPGLIAHPFSAFVAATIVLEFVRGTRARKALGATSWPGVLLAHRAKQAALRRLRRPRGDLLLAIGIAETGAFDTVAEARLTRGRVDGGRQVPAQYRALDERRPRMPRRFVPAAVSRGNRDLGTLEAGKNAYTIEEQVSNEGRDP